MINRIQLLRNIGQFESVSAGATIPFTRLTVVYSENGRGKTTLAAVLRSLATGDPVLITERKRLTAQHPPHVVLECDGDPAPAVFMNNSWSRTLGDLLIFDDDFVDQNVHSGLAVETHHRQNLHELILGTQAVALSRKLQSLVERIEGHNRELRVRERAIPAANRGPLSVDEFCALPARPSVDQDIQETERALAASQEQDAILETPAFESLSLPEFNLTEIEGLLQKDLAGLDSTVLARVQDHFEKLGQGGETWVNDGMRRIGQKESDAAVALCPFCGQDLSGSSLLQHYRAYFSDAYAALKRESSDTLAGVNHAHGGDVPAGFERMVRVAVERRQFWSRFCEVAQFTLDTAAIVRDWSAAREAVMAQLSEKQAAPLERMGVSTKIRELIAKYEAQREAIAAINKKLQEANTAIGVVKERAAAANSQVLASDLARFKAIKARHEPVTANLCEEYIRERSAKEATEEQRSETKTSLEEHRARIFPGYQAAINVFLQRFNADFRLDSVTYANTRGGATCTYDVLINNTPVPIGGSDPPPGAPSFRNTLSARRS